MDATFVVVALAGFLFALVTDVPVAQANVLNVVSSLITFGKYFHQFSCPHPPPSSHPTPSFPLIIAVIAVVILSRYLDDARDHRDPRTKDENPSGKLHLSIHHPSPIHHLSIDSPSIHHPSLSHTSSIPQSIPSPITHHSVLHLPSTLGQDRII